MEGTGTTVTDRSYKYDVAFSFLAQDEGLATQLNDLVQERMTTFLYSERQKELAGKDGEEAFNLVFGKEARLVVVLYREGWGSRTWTRIEQTAIKNRGFDEGYSFTTFIPLDDPPKVPAWLPKTQLYVGLKRWGLQGAASVVDARVTELGGDPKEESSLDRAARLKRAQSARDARKAFIDSPQGIKEAEEAFAALISATRSAVDTIRQVTGLELSIKQRPEQIVILGGALGLSLGWTRRYTNTLDESKLQISLWDGHPPMHGIMLIDKPDRLRATEGAYEFDGVVRKGWQISDDHDRILSSEEVAEQAINMLIDEIGKREARKRR